MEMLSLKFGSGGLLLAFWLPALAYIAVIHLLPFPGDFALKSLPILFLAATAWFTIPGVTGKLMAIGFLLSAGGDISLSFEGDKFFIMGLSFFLLAHIMYVVVFARDFSFSPNKLPVMILLAIFAVGMAVRLYSGLGEMRLPVFIYITAILAMGLTAANWQGERPWWLLAGAIIFMLSDSMIAINKFLVPISWSKYFIMATYYAGQFLIFSAFLPKRA